MQDGVFETFARKICEFCMAKYFLPWMREHGVVQSYRAKVISVDSSAKTMVIQRPYDTQITVPYGQSASGLSAGDGCVVFVLGEASNAVVVSDSQLNL